MEYFSLFYIVNSRKAHRVKGFNHSFFTVIVDREVSHSTGLGLALSQKMAKLINGKIVIESKGLNQGVKAKFIFSSL
jgi:light-regulated signal transduction histidine kinase (bacteriophytochrome)